MNFGGGIDFASMFGNMFGGGGGGGGGVPRGGGGQQGSPFGGGGRPPGGGGSSRGAGKKDTSGEEAMYKGDANVQLLTSATFPGAKDASFWIIEFFTPW